VTAPSQPLLDLLARLVGFPTLSDASNLALIDFAQSYLEAHGATCRRFPNADGDKAALLATIGPADRPGIVLSGHSDVVPVAGQAWSSDPYVLRIAEGRAYGRGSVDMKGFVALAMAAAPAMAAQTLTTPIHILISYDEETTCLGPLDAIASFGRDLPLPRAAIVGEPTGLEVADAHKGVSIFESVVTGRDVHSANPGKGANAILGAAAMIREIEAIADMMITRGDPTGRFDPPYSTVHVGTVQGGTALNIVPKRCAIGWEIRAVPGIDTTEAVDRLAVFAAQEVLPCLRKTAPEADIVTTCDVEVPGLAPEPGSQAESLALKLAGRNATISVSFATEAGHFQAAGIPTVVCGPGFIDQAHQVDEYIDLSQLAAGEAFMQRLVDWCRMN
jgi:acetylornithine deacetylase